MPASIQIQAGVNVPYLANTVTQGVHQGVKQAGPINIRANVTGIDSKKFTLPLGRITGDLTQFQSSLDASVARVLAFGASASVLAGITSAMKQMVVAGIQVEKTLADINVILNLSSSGLAGFSKGMFDIARRTGQSFKDVGAAAVEFSRQGLGAQETLKRLNDAMILSRLSGLDAAQAVNTLTATINGFNQEALSSTEIVNRLASVDASFAVSTQDLANALARSGAVAQDAKVSFNELVAAVTAVQQTTARGGAVIGNGLKSIFTRIQRSSTRDSLEALGVSTQNASGEFRGAIPILRDYAKIMDNLSDSQKSATDEQIAGVFQINTLKALLKDLNKEYSIYNGALDTAASATDEANKRSEQLNLTTDALIKKTSAGLLQLGAMVEKLGVDKAIRNVLVIADTLSSKLVGAIDEDSGNVLGRNLVKGIGDFLAGPGLIMIGKTVFNLVRYLGKEIITALRAIQNVNAQAGERQKLEFSILETLINQKIAVDNITQSGQSVVAQQNEILKIIRLQADEQERIRRLRSAVDTAVVSGKYALDPRVGGPVIKKAAGYLPHFAQEEAMARSLGAPSSVRAKRSKGTIGGRSFVLNDREIEIPRFGKNGDSAVIPTYAKGFIPNFAITDPVPPNVPSGKIYVPFAKSKVDGTNFFTRSGVNGLINTGNLNDEQRAYINSQLTEKKALSEKQKINKEQRAQDKISVAQGIDGNYSLNALDLGVGTIVGIGSSRLDGRGRISGKELPDHLLAKIGASKSSVFDISNVPIGTIANARGRGTTGTSAREFIDTQQHYFTEPLKDYTEDIFSKLLGNSEKTFQQALGTVTSKIDQLLPGGTQGSIFESALKLASGKAGIFGSDETRSFDFEETGEASSRLKKFFLPDAKGKVRKVEAKREGNLDAIGTLIKKSLNDPMIGGKTLELLRSQTIKQKKVGDDPQAQIQKMFAGFVPNFAYVDDVMGLERELSGNRPIFDTKPFPHVRNSSQPTFQSAIADHGGLKRALADSAAGQGAAGFAGGYLPNFAANINAPRQMIGSAIDNKTRILNERQQNAMEYQVKQAAVSAQTEQEVIDATRKLAMQRRLTIDTEETYIRKAKDMFGILNPQTGNATTTQQPVASAQPTATQPEQQSKTDKLLKGQAIFFAAQGLGYTLGSALQEKGGVAGAAGAGLTGGLQYGSSASFLASSLGASGGLSAGIGVSLGSFVFADKMLTKLNSNTEKYAKSLEMVSASYSKNSEAVGKFLSTSEAVASAQESGDFKLVSKLNKELEDSLGQMDASVAAKVRAFKNLGGDELGNKVKEMLEGLKNKVTEAQINVDFENNLGYEARRSMFFNPLMSKEEREAKMRGQEASIAGGAASTVSSSRLLSDRSLQESLKTFDANSKDATGLKGIISPEMISDALNPGSENNYTAKAIIAMVKELLRARLSIADFSDKIEKTNESIAKENKARNDALKAFLSNINVLAKARQKSREFGVGVLDIARQSGFEKNTENYSVGGFISETQSKISSLESAFAFTRLQNEATSSGAIGTKIVSAISELYGQTGAYVGTKAISEDRGVAMNIAGKAFNGMSLDQLGAQISILKKRADQLSNSDTKESPSIIAENERVAKGLNDTVAKLQAIYEESVEQGNELKKQTVAFALNKIATERAARQALVGRLSGSSLFKDKDSRANLINDVRGARAGNVGSLQNVNTFVQQFAGVNTIFSDLLNSITGTKTLVDNLSNVGSTLGLFSTQKTAKISANDNTQRYQTRGLTDSERLQSIVGGAGSRLAFLNKERAPTVGFINGAGQNPSGGGPSILRKSLSNIESGKYGSADIGSLAQASILMGTIEAAKTRQVDIKKRASILGVVSQSGYNLPETYKGLDITSRYRREEAAYSKTQTVADLIRSNALGGGFKKAIFNTETGFGGGSDGLSVLASGAENEKRLTSQLRTGEGMEKLANIMAQFSQSSTDVLLRDLNGKAGQMLQQLSNMQKLVLPDGSITLAPLEVNMSVTDAVPEAVKSLAKKIQDELAPKLEAAVKKLEALEKRNADVGTVAPPPKTPNPNQWHGGII